MIQEFQYNQVVAPMAEIWRLWEREKKVTLPWFFELLQGLIDPRPILYFTDMESSFFQALHQEFKQRDICPEYIIPADDFFKTGSLSELLEEGGHLSVLIFKPLGPEVIEKIKSLESFIHQLKFVVLARKDWNVENTYRSIPHFMRSRLYVDFPMSLRPTRPSHGGGLLLQWCFDTFRRKLYEKFGMATKLYRKFGLQDPFLSPREWVPMVETFKKQFPGFPVRSYCPNLFLYSEFLSSNVSHFSGPRKLNSKKKYLSCIFQDSREFEALMHSKTMIQNSDQVEILLAQTNEKTEPVSTPISGSISDSIPGSIPEGLPDSISIHPYLVHPQDPGKPVSKALVNNFLAGQATGRYLLFLDKEVLKNPEGFLDAVFKESFDEFEFLIREKVMIFRRDDFLKMGGFDILFTNKSLLWLDSSFRYSLFKGRDFNYETKQSGSQWSMISHKYACEEKFKFCLSGMDSRTLSEDKKSWSLGFYKLYWLVFYVLYPVRKIYYFCELQYEKRILGLHFKDKLKPGS